VINISLEHSPTARANKNIVHLLEHSPTARRRCAEEENSTQKKKPQHQ
jgi:hypothetical protein